MFQERQETLIFALTQAVLRAILAQTTPLLKLPALIFILMLMVFMPDMLALPDLIMFLTEL